MTLTAKQRGDRDGIRLAQNDPRATYAQVQSSARRGSELYYKSEQKREEYFDAFLNGFQFADWWYFMTCGAKVPDRI